MKIKKKGLDIISPTFNSVDEMIERMEHHMRDLPRHEKTYLYVSRKLSPVFSFLRYDIKNGVSNLIKWFPIIWKDRHWDESYLFTMIAHKTKLMADNHKYRDWAESAEGTASELYRASELAKSIAEDSFDVEYATEHWVRKRKEAIEELCQLISEKSHTWWD